jgi:UDP-glucuronate decarboxylase
MGSAVDAPCDALGRCKIADCGTPPTQESNKSRHCGGVSSMGRSPDSSPVVVPAPPTPEPGSPADPISSFDGSCPPPLARRPRSTWRITTAAMAAAMIPAMASSPSIVSKKGIGWGDTQLPYGQFVVEEAAAWLELDRPRRATARMAKPKTRGANRAGRLSGPSLEDTCPPTEFNHARRPSNTIRRAMRCRREPLEFRTPTLEGTARVIDGGRRADPPRSESGSSAHRACSLPTRHTVYAQGATTNRFRGPTLLPPEEYLPSASSAPVGANRSKVVHTSVVTGAAGFLGSHLTDRLLADGDTLLGIDNLSTGRLANLAEARRSPHFHFQRADIVRCGPLPRAERYFHLASPASPPAYQRDPIVTLRVNAEGTLAVLEAARRADARVLLASTSEVYGDPEEHPQRESYWGHVNPVGLRSCYDEGKRYAEALSMAYRRSYGLDVRVARIFNTYGPRMDPSDGRVISNFMRQGLLGEPMTLYGRGQQTRSFCYVADLVEALALLVRAPSKVSTPMNLGNPAEVTVARVARLVARTLGVPAKMRFVPLPEDDPRRRRPDISLARKYLCWSPHVPLEEGLQETAVYFRARLKGRRGAPS